MDGFTIIDGLVALVIVFSALLAYARGFMRELIAILSWGAATVIGFMFGAQAQPLMHEIPKLGPLLRDNCELGVIAGFGAVFALTLASFALIGPYLSSLVQRSALNGIDQAVGFIFGVLRGILLVGVVYFFYETLLSANQISVIDDSRSARVFSGFAAQLKSENPQETLSWITTQYESLVGSCVDNKAI